MELKSCKCGGIPKFLRRKAQNTTWVWNVQCPMCGVVCQWHLSKEKAAAAWNRREGNV